MAMIMSTADSWINTSSVIFSHNFCQPLGIQVNHELLISRVFSVVIGICTVFLALSATSLLKLLLLSANFYKPIVTVPLILAILGFWSSSKSVLIGMFCGGLTAFIWKTYLTPILDIDSVVPAMLANLITFMDSHYLLKQSGGWVGIKDDQELREIRRQRKNKFKAVSKSFSHTSNFSIVEYCKAHTPKNDLIYSYFAFVTLLTIIVTFSLNKAIYHENTIVINFLQFTSLFISTLFICRNLLLSSEEKEKYLGVIWYISIFISLAFISSFLVFINKFSQISLVIFIINLATIGMLLHRQTTYDVDRSN